MRTYTAALVAGVYVIAPAAALAQDTTTVVDITDSTTLIGTLIAAVVIAGLKLGLAELREWLATRERLSAEKRVLLLAEFDRLAGGAVDYAKAKADALVDRLPDTVNVNNAALARALEYANKQGPKLLTELGVTPIELERKLTGLIMRRATDDERAVVIEAVTAPGVVVPTGTMPKAPAGFVPQGGESGLFRYQIGPNTMTVNR